MRITMRWVGQSGKTGRAPGKFSTVHDAEIAARALLDGYPKVTQVAIYHETFGHVTDVTR